MDSILNKRHYRNAFYLLVALILMSALTLRFLVLPQFDTTLEASIPKFSASLLDGLVISLIVTIFIGSFVFWLTPKIFKKSVMDVIEPREIGPLLKKAVADTRSWTYKGACGRYTRATTLPSLASAAKHEGLGRDIRITILNPNNDQLCAEYATYRRSLKSANNSKLWTESKVKEEVLATIVSALRYKHEEPLLRIELYLIDHFSAFRFDISDQYVIVTKEDKEAAGLRADAGTYFYDSYKDDVRLSERQSIKVESQNKIPIGALLTKDSLHLLIREVDLVSEERLTSLNLESIVTAINSPEDPYST
ncbi:MAG: hypothetical protein KUG82_19750 [Pseudomonadales bacterium]|nr:hypothetical protein [Pseudomonadales bacterium]